MGGEKKGIKTSRTTRAGLHFPIHKVRKDLKVKLGAKRNFQKGVEVIYAAVAEYLIERLLVDAADRVTKGNYIDSGHLHASIKDENSEIAGIFPQHATGMW